MQDITTLFTAIGDFFIKADWYAMVKWPFWILLCAVAAGGVYCARFGKNTLMNRSISGVLNLLIIYLITSIVHIYAPLLQFLLPDLPFCTMTEEAITLVNPFISNLVEISPILLKLMLLMFLINLMDMLIACGKTIPGWCVSQSITLVLILLSYVIVTKGISVLLPSFLTPYSFIPVIIVAVFAVFMFIMKIVFTMFFSGSSHTFSAVYKFFTINKFGSLLTISALSFLGAMGILGVMHLTENSVLTYHDVNTDGLCVITLLLIVVLHIFGMYYSDKKKA